MPWCAPTELPVTGCARVSHGVVRGSPDVSGCARVSRPRTVGPRRLKMIARPSTRSVRAIDQPVKIYRLRSPMLAFRNDVVLFLTVRVPFLPLESVITATRYEPGPRACAGGVPGHAAPAAGFLLASPVSSPVFLL